MKSVIVVKKRTAGQRQSTLLGCVGCNFPPSSTTTSPKGEIRLSLWWVRSLLMSLGINMQKRGLCGRGRREGKKRQSRIAAVPGWTINLCLFQSHPWPKWCKIQAGMSSISVSSSVPFCAGWRATMMYWFCHLCSVHSMLTWKGRVGLWREGLLVARLWLDIFFSLSLLSPLVMVSHSVSHPCHSALHSIYSHPHLSHFIPFHICIYLSAELHLSPLISAQLYLSQPISTKPISLHSPTYVNPFITHLFIHFNISALTFQSTSTTLISYPISIFLILSSFIHPFPCHHQAATIQTHEWWIKYQNA